MSARHKTDSECDFYLSRFLEFFILNGASPNALEAVLAQLKDPNRRNPQDLDSAVIGRSL